MTIEWKGKYEL